MQNHSLLRKFIFIIILLLAVTFPLLNIVKLWDAKLYDFQVDVFRNNNEQTLSDDVVLIGIDEQTYQQFREPLALWHKHFGLMFKILAKAEIAVLGLDLSMPDRSYNNLIKGQDQALLTGMMMLKRVAPIVLGLTVNHNGQTRKIYPPYLSVAGKNGKGYVLWKFDNDRVVRRYEPLVNRNNKQISTLTSQMAHHLGIESIQSGLIDYTFGNKIDYVPMHTVINWFQSGKLDKLKQVFKNKAVLVGTVLPFEDRHYQPVNLTAWEKDNSNLVPGVLIHVQALRNILNKGFIQPLGWYWVILVNICLAFLWWAKMTPLKAMSASIIGMLMLFVTQYILLSKLIFFPVFSSILIVILSLNGRQLIEQFFQAIERQRLRNAFGGYVSPDVLNGILSGEFKPGIHGERKRICVLFSDIRGFTTISENMQPEDIIRFLNKYLEAMTEAIQDNGGTVDKFMGDGIMAFFGAPKELENSAQNAMDAAQSKLEKLDKLNKIFQKKNMPDIKIGIGLHIGDAVVGNIGSEKRNEYTAIGDVVNTASRLEGLTKQAGYPVVVSSAVIDALPKDMLFDDLGKMSVKGRAPVSVFGWPAKIKSEET